MLNEVQPDNLEDEANSEATILLKSPEKHKT